MQALRVRRAGRSQATGNNEGSSRIEAVRPSSPTKTGLFTRKSIFANPNLPYYLFIFIQSVFCIFLLVRLSFRKPQQAQGNRAFNPLPLSTHFDFYITIYTYDRPRQLLRLLKDIASEADATRVSVAVNILDDNSYGCTFPPVSRNIFRDPSTSSLSSSNYSGDTDALYQVPLPTTLTSCTAAHRFAQVEEFAHARKWRMFVSPYRHGRRRYWHLIQQAHNLLFRSPRADHYIFLPDDDRLSSNFFQTTVAAWQSISSEHKMTLMLHVEESREHEAVWTDLKPLPVNDNVTRIGWVESGNFMCTVGLLELLNWTFPYIAPQRWVDNPPISSGVGATLSEFLYSRGLHMYRTRTSLVAHVGVQLSQMNAAFRERGAATLRTKYFADGDAAYERLLAESATVTASMASHWVREASLHAAVHSLSPQVDRLNVFLNGYDGIPSFLRAPYITVATSQQVGTDLGDIGKFYWASDLRTDFHATVDDDIEYPADYIQRLLDFRATQRGPAVVGVHGIRLRDDWLRPHGNARHGRGYYGSREVWMATEEVSEAVGVHIIGTGTMLYRVSDVGDLDLKQVFPKPNMADIWFGMLAQQRRLPMVVVPHKKGWMKEVEGTFDDSIYKRASARRSAERAQTRAVLSLDRWQLFNVQ